MKQKLKDIQWVVCDIDGTLLVEEETLPETVVSAIRKLAEVDVVFLFASGRVPARISPLMRQIGMQDSFLVACNGALVVRGEDILFQETLPVERVQELVCLADQEDMTVLYTEGTTEYCHRETMDSAYKRTTRGSYFPIKELNFSSTNIVKLNIFAKGRIDDLAEHIKKCRPYLTITQYGKDGVEIVSQAVTKQTGVAHYCSLTGRSFDTLLAIGDNENDVELLKSAHVSVAVCNGSLEAKQAAMVVTEGQAARGVEEILQQLITAKGTKEVI